MDWTEAPAVRRKPPANGYSPILTPPRHVSTLPDFLGFCDEVARHPRAIPILAGLYPLASFRNADFMNNHVPGVVVPKGILDRMSRCKTKPDGIEAGIEIAREIRHALTGRVAGFQVSAPFGRIDVALKVLAD